MKNVHLRSIFAYFFKPLSLRVLSNSVLKSFQTSFVRFFVGLGSDLAWRFFLCRRRLGIEALKVGSFLFLGRLRVLLGCCRWALETSLRYHVRQPSMSFIKRETFVHLLIFLIGYFIIMCQKMMWTSYRFRAFFYDILILLLKKFVNGSIKKRE